MAELTTTKLNAESHLLLDQPLLRLPYELSRRTFKNAQRYIEHANKELPPLLTSALQSASKTSSPAPTLESLDTLISKLTSTKRKLEALRSEEQKLNASTAARIAHLDALFSVPSLVDVKYDEWSRTRLVRLLVDYLLREGYAGAAEKLAQERGVEELVDVDAFVACHRIERSLRVQRSTGLALAWCKEHAQGLRRLGSMLEFQLRLQQYIELVRMGHEGGGGREGMEGVENGDEGDGGVEVDMRDGGGGFGGVNEKLVEARAHAKKYLSASGDFDLMNRVGGLLAFRPWDEVEPYKSLYSPDRWTHLAALFLSTHHTLYSLPSRPLLHIALSAGLSALKTPSCHSAYASSSGNASSTTTTVCPICSTELNELARNVPYAHHTKSIVENDPVVLPNGRVYGRERLGVYNELVGETEGWVRDPVGGRGERWKLKEVRKVFIM
ncbi:protein FYV10 [Polyplosphaeria fusca]|uniref:Protein FYV10 n=1 Tax=Polyplosphaeria fusca TaxID=682080 RepID=A0A9P4QRJ7_9PLEO|nr:protein FYV10 [Polyplosphaeria fusca]